MGTRIRRWLVRSVVGLVVLIIVLAAAGAAYQAVATRRDLAAVPPPGRLVDVGGYRLHIWCMGSGSPAVILESGLGSGAFAWPYVQPQVAAFTQVCTYDRAGLGYSDSSPAPRTSRQIAHELSLLVDRSGIHGPVVVAAASLGAFSARLFAAEHPQRVGGLVLIDASHEKQRERYAAVGQQDTFLPPGLKLIVMSASLGLLRIRGETLGLGAESADPSVRKYLEATAHRASRYRASYDELMAWPQSASQVAASKLSPNFPLIVISAGTTGGAPDPIHRELQQDLVSLTNRACQVIATNSGHVVSNEDPRLVVAAIRDMVGVAADSGRYPDCAGLNRAASAASEPASHSARASSIAQPRPDVRR